MHAGGGVQVSLHALIRAEEILVLPLDLREGFPQLVCHAVERRGEVSHEIDALAQVAPGDLLGLPGQMAKIRVEILERLKDVRLAGGDIEIEVAARQRRTSRLPVPDTRRRIDWRTPRPA